MKYAVEMGSGAMMYILNFIKTGSGNQKLIGGDIDTKAYFYFFNIRNVG
jgi:hypothetical protein